MRFRLSLIIVATILLFATSCSNIDTKISNNDLKVDVTVGGVRVTTGDINSKSIGQLEKDNAELLRQLETVKSQLAAQDTLLTEEVKKLQEQMKSLLEQSQRHTERLSELKRNDAILRKQNEQAQAELKQERTAREAAEESARQAKEALKAAQPDPEDTVRPIVRIENRMDCRVVFRVMRDSGSWQHFTLNPNEHRNFERNGESLPVEFLYKDEWVGVTVSDQSEESVYYFGLNENGELDLLYD